MAIRNIKFKNRDFKIAYEVVNPTKNINIIFLHGWGSNKEVMQIAFQDKFTNFRHIYLDLMGFGKSENNYILTTKDYFEISDNFLNELKINKDIVVGHSFGGKVATLLNPKLLILLSSAGIIEKKSFIIKMKILLFKLLKNIGLNKFRNFFVSSDGKNLSEPMYETFKNVVNENFENYFANYNGETVIFWGIEDKATTLQSGKKIASLIKNSQFFELEGEHYFFLKNSNFISKEIEKKIYNNN